MAFYFDGSRYRYHGVVLGRERDAVELPNTWEREDPLACCGDPVPRDEPRYRHLNIGWLNGLVPHRKGLIFSRRVMDRLFAFCVHSACTCRGMHACNLAVCFLRRRRTPLVAARGDVEASLGGGQIRVIDEARRVVYHAPDLIYHYIVGHAYRPSNAFLRAVMRCPLPPSEAYVELYTKVFGPTCLHLLYWRRRRRRARVAREA